MFQRPRQSGNHVSHSSLSWVILSLVAMAFLSGFGVAMLITRLQDHVRPDAIIPALILSVGGMCVQFGMLRFLIRHRTQASD
jgi:hypothetical protein